MANLEPHRHVNHASLQHDPFTHHTKGHLTDNTKENLFTKNRHDPALLPMYKGTLFSFGGTTEFLVADVLPDIVKTIDRRSSDSFQRYW